MSDLRLQELGITRHGDTVGYYIPARRKRTEAEPAALKEAVSLAGDISRGRNL